jgi:hypothetical protein
MRLSPPAVAAAVTSTHSPMATVRTFEAADFASVLDIFQACEPASNIGVEIGDSKMVEIGKFYCALQIKSCDLQSVETLTLTYSLDKANTCALCSSATDAAVVPHGNFFVLIDSETGQHIGQVGLEAKEGGIGEVRSRKGICIWMFENSFIFISLISSDPAHGCDGRASKQEGRRQINHRTIGSRSNAQAEAGGADYAVCEHKRHQVLPNERISRGAFVHASAACVGRAN